MNCVLSFCIATYNRQEMLKELIESILACPSDKIEVVVSDNCSTDATMEMLMNIGDKRLSIYCNDENIGGAQNAYRAIRRANGMYAMYLNDREIVYTAEIPNIINFLEGNSEIVGGICYRGTNEDGDNIIILSGKNAVEAIGYRTDIHPSGSFFKTDILKEIGDQEWNGYSENAKEYVYPLDQLFGYISIKGKVCIYRFANKLYDSRLSFSGKSLKSHYDNTRDILYYGYTPEAGLKRVLNHQEHFISLYKENEFDLNILQFKHIIYNIFCVQINFIRHQYFSVINGVWRDHYQVKEKKFGRVKKIYIICDFWKKYRKKIQTNNVLNDKWIVKKEFRFVIKCIYEIIIGK